MSSGLSAGRPSSRTSAPNVDVRALIAEGDNVRINFEVPRETRDQFKAWAATNGTSIKDELTRHIYELLRRSGK